MIDRTDDFDDQAKRIADFEAQEVWEATGNWGLWYQKWRKVYHQVIFELTSAILLPITPPEILDEFLASKKFEKPVAVILEVKGFELDKWPN